MLTSPGVLRMRTMPVPAPGPREMLVRVLATGICGSDLAAYRGSHPYKRAPAVLGHELCGVVERIGADVRLFAPGERVCAAAYSPCETCARCAAGAPNLCDAKRSLSHGGWDGAFADYVVLHENMAFALPPDCDPALGALVEPLAIARHALRLAPSPAGGGGALAVLGTGGIGLCAATAAGLLAFDPVVCLDLDRAKGALALAIGASASIHAADPDALAQARRALGGAADVVVVCSGHPGALDEAMALARPGGTIVVVSYFPRGAPLAVDALVMAELTIRGSALAGPQDVADAIAWVAHGRVEAARLVRRRLPLERAAEAMRAVERGAPGRTLIEVAEAGA